MVKKWIIVFLHYRGSPMVTVVKLVAMAGMKGLGGGVKE